MPFNPAQFVFQPRPLQNFDFGAGFRDLANTRLQNRQLAHQQAQLGEQRAQRQDTNSFNAATFARDDANDQYKNANTRYEEGAKLGQQARAAAQAGKKAQVEALLPSLRAYGWTAERTPEGDYIIKDPNEPTRGPLDIQGARKSIYGGSPATTSQPFQVPGFGPNGKRNPFDPQVTPGVAASALPDVAPASAPPVNQPPVPAPPNAPVPGSAEADLATVNSMSSPDDEEASSPSAMSPPAASGAAGGPALASLDPESKAMPARINAEAAQPSPGQNPFNTPSFAPYRINMQEVAKRNQAENQPFLDAFQQGSPVDFQGRANAFNRNIAQSGLSPEASAELSSPLLKQLTEMYRTEKGAEIAAGRLGNTKDRQAEQREQKASDDFYRRKDVAYKNGRTSLKDSGLYKLKDKVQAVHAALAQAPRAHDNPYAANNLVRAAHRMFETGVITDKDFDHSEEGVRAVASAFINKAEREFFNQKGLLPDVIDDMVETINIAKKALDRELESSSHGLFEMYKSAKDPATRAGLADAIRQGLPDMKEAWPEGVENEPSDYGASNSGPAAGDRLPTKVPLPKTLDGKSNGKKPSARSRVDAVLSGKKNASP